MELSKISKDIIEKHMVRNTRKQKDGFLSFIKDTLLTNLAYVAIDESKCGFGKNKNIIIGDLNSASIIFTAHYDTPKRLLIPGANKVTVSKYKILYCLLLSLKVAAIILLTMILSAISILCILFSLNYFFSDMVAYIITYKMTEILYFCSGLGGIIPLALLLIAPVNKQNYNDNTSGVITIIETLIKWEFKTDRIAFVLFDNEEWGYKGSKLFKKEFGAKIYNKLIINFDCVGKGDHIVFSCKPNVTLSNSQMYGLKKLTASTLSKKFIFKKYAQSKMNSDYKIFNKSIGVMATMAKKNGTLYIDRIHTNKDVILEIQNIDLLVQFNIELAKDLNASNKKSATGVTIPENATT